MLKARVHAGGQGQPRPRGWRATDYRAWQSKLISARGRAAKEADCRSKAAAASAIRHFSKRIIPRQATPSCTGVSWRISCTNSTVTGFRHYYSRAPHWRTACTLIPPAARWATSICGWWVTISSGRSAPCARWATKRAWLIALNGHCAVGTRLRQLLDAARGKI